MARTRRAKLQVATWYHLIARVTDRQFLLESDEQKAHLADILRRTLEFSGVELGTYVIMDNHFHLFVRVPEARELDDGEILRRIAVLNGKERAEEVEEKWAPCGDRPLNFLAVNGAHLRNSPPRLLMIGNNYLKQLAYGARANSPAPISRSSSCHDSECSRCVRRTMLFLKVVLVVSKSQCAWVEKRRCAPVNAEVELGLAHRTRMWYDSCVMFKGAMYLKMAMCSETSCLSAARGRVVRVFTSNTPPHQSLKRYT